MCFKKKQSILRKYYQILQNQDFTVNNQNFYLVITYLYPQKKRTNRKNSRVRNARLNYSAIKSQKIYIDL